MEIQLAQQSREQMPQKDSGYLITPLLDLDSIHLTRDIGAIAESVDNRSKDIELVYREDADEVHNIIQTSLSTSLHKRLDRARMARDHYIFGRVSREVTGEHCLPRKLTVEDHHVINKFLYENRNLCRELEAEGVEPTDAQADEVGLYLEIMNDIGAIDSPSAALEAIVSQPNLPSVELGYVNRPLQWNGAERLDQEVSEAVAKILPDAQFVDRKSRIKISRVQFDKGEARFVMVPSKREFAVDEKTGLSIMARSTYLVDLQDSHHGDHIDTQAVLKKKINRLLRLQHEMGVRNSKPGDDNHNTHDLLLCEIAGLIDGMLVNAYQPEWLQPLTKSYYAARR